MTRGSDRPLSEANAEMGAAVDVQRPQGLTAIDVASR